jgi:uncharacterized protein YndB with AHSA1/START domain
MSASSSAPQVHIQRRFRAPRELVFAAWTNQQHLLSWFAPTGCSIAFRQIDVRPGGEFHSCITTPDGKECWCKGTYREVQKPERIVFTMAVADAQGNLLEPTAAGMDPAWPRETVVTVTLQDVGGATELTLHQTVDEALAKRTGAHPSWLIMLDRLAKMVEG